jgi:predicted nuclease of predicted toxin-antitoxin system
MISRLIVADENIDYRLTKLLRENNFEVFTIFENERGIKDTNVLTIAHDKNAFLITEDKDFGNLAIRNRLPHNGILLIRRKRLTALETAQIVLQILSTRFDELENHFSVLRDDKLIIRE